MVGMTALAQSVVLEVAWEVQGQVVQAAQLAVHQAPGPSPAVLVVAQTYLAPQTLV